MRKLNIIKRAKKRIVHRIVSTTMDDSVWLVAREYQNTVYYVKEMDKKSQGVIWTSKRSNSMKFRTRTGITQFIRDNLNDRNDIYIIYTGKI